MFDQNDFIENFWYKPIPEEMIFCNHKKFATEKCLKKMLGSKLFLR